ncbi:MAG: DUF1634 domain-containing protein [Terriglobales bacterium]
MPTPSNLPPEPPANVYTAVFRALLWGMVASTVLFALGVFRALEHATTISLGAMVIPPWTATLRGLLRLDPFSLMLLGTVVLILTPVVRVALALIAFVRARDRRFTLVTGAVLAVIVLTAILGRLGLR